MVVNTSIHARRGRFIAPTTTDDGFEQIRAVINPVGARFIERTADLSALVRPADKSAVRTINRAPTLVGCPVMGGLL